MSEVLKVEGLRKSFQKEHTLDGLDLILSKNRVTTILGKSGVGKSVLLRCLSGLMQADAGSITLLGKEVFPHPVDSQWRNHMGYLFQGDALFEHLNVEENVALPLTESTGKKVSAFSDDFNPLLERLDLLDAKKKSPAELSGGMRRRVALARCLIRKPELVLFDEPTTGLDPVRSRAVFEMIREYCDELGFSALVVSHDIGHALEYSDEVYVLKGGRLEDAPASESALIKEL